ncbi:ABC transporter substrate-binding protein [Tsukamurella sp. 8F]|uniref:ABC transporter substrate-binding protein n=1 Tax=unclassified Tsukamurella TaxID=2633480 RepID=UPI0023B890EF|nr:MULTISPECIES: ABC transporter substrate-binding protein [unclassified Tsukamurella]MDF0531164.1 ABC transporter substrate-binding protein [Tsukamurella sp. 8J]MDF0585889.1 ABC transporter substrate-binding protein [Tsukamurella sp. 8F]
MTSTSPRRRTTLIAALLSAAAALAACGDSSDTPAGEMRSFKADNGTVEIPTHPQRIVTIGSPGVFLQIGVEPVGMSGAPGKEWMSWLTPQQREAYEAAENLGNLPNLDYEQIAGLNPDLITVAIPREAWERNADVAKRLKAIAPTAYISINPSKTDMSPWKAQLQRTADAVDARGRVDDDKAAYDKLVADIKGRYGSLLRSTTFAFVNRTEGEEGRFEREYSSSYCTVAATEAGLDIPGETSVGTKTFETVSMERISDLSQFDAIIYRSGPDKKPAPAVEPVLESNAWKSLPQVSDGRALGVQCDPTLTYSAKAAELRSIEEALDRLASKK